MRTSHALMLRLFHDPQYDFERVEVVYVNRGAPGDRSTIQGRRIHHLDQGGMEIESDASIVFIPYHRIRRISYDGKEIWRKGERIFPY